MIDYMRNGTVKKRDEMILVSLLYVDFFNRYTISRRDRIQ